MSKIFKEYTKGNIVQMIVEGDMLKINNIKGTITLGGLISILKKMEQDLCINNPNHNKFIVCTFDGPFGDLRWELERRRRKDNNIWEECEETILKTTFSGKVKDQEIYVPYLRLIMDNLLELDTKIAVQELKKNVA